MRARAWLVRPFGSFRIGVGTCFGATKARFSAAQTLFEAKEHKPKLPPYSGA